MQRRAEDIPWGAVAFVMVLSAAALAFALVISLWPQSAPQTPPAAGAGGEAEGPGSELSQFWAQATQRIPNYTTFESACPVDATVLAVPNTPTDNNFGGVTTDLMKIALVQADDGSNRPEFDLQEFEQKLVTCPTCGGTFMAVDLSMIITNRIDGAQENVKYWDLQQAAPGLDLASEPDWTYDVRSYLRYKQQQNAGYPASELAYTALAGAYCSNFGAWYGRETVIPSPALYALAAANLRQDLEQGLPESEFERSVNSMLLGEMNRLLGREQQAAHWFAQARQQGGLTEGFQTVIDFLGRELEEGNHSLMRIPDREEMPPPPFGWQVDLMLPGINGQLDAHRGDWAELETVEEIESAIAALISGRFGQNN